MNPEFERIYRDNSKYVYNVALGMLKNNAEAEDIMQNVFIKLFDNYNAFRGDSDIKTYLYRMTVNKCLDLFRLQKIRINKLEHIELPEFKPVGPNYELEAMLERLEPNVKAAVLLSEIGGFSYKEIAGIMGINLGTVKSRIHRGINKLRKLAGKEI